MPVFLRKSQAWDKNLIEKFDKLPVPYKTLGDAAGVFLIRG